MRAVTFISAAVFAFAASAGAASAATTLTFDSLALGGLGNPYTSQGFTFTSSDGQGFASWGIGGGIPFSADHSGTSATLYLNSWTGSTTLSKDGGGAFHLNSIDFADIYDEGDAQTLTMTFDFAGGGSSSQILNIDGSIGLQTFKFSLPALVSVIWTPEQAGTHAVQWDNVVLGDVAATTPIPATLPLLVSALGGLGFIGWRRKRASAT